MQPGQAVRAVFLSIFEACFEAYPHVSYDYHRSKKDIHMNNKFAFVALSVNKINRQHIQLVLTLIALAMLVLGVGAPNDGGGPN
jgi:hypothetical protein